MDHLLVAERFFKRDDWRYDVLHDGEALRLGFTGKLGSWIVIVRGDDDGVLSVDSILEQFAPETRQADVVELITRINWDCRLGAFQFDYSDGEMRYHSAIDVEGGELTDTMFKNLLFNSLATTDHYFGAFMAVCYANVDAINALLALESPS